MKLSNLALVTILALMVPICHSWCYSSQLATTAPINSFDLSFDGKQIAIANSDNTVNIYSMIDFSLLSSFTAVAKEPTSVKFAKNNNMLAIGYNSHSQVTILNATTYSVIHTLNTNLADTKQLDFDWENQMIMICGNPNMIEMYSLTDWSIIISKSAQKAQSCKFLRTGKFISGQTTGNFKLFYSGGWLQWVSIHTSTTIYGIDVAMDDTNLAAADYDNLKIWKYDSSSNVPLGSFTTPSKITEVAFSMDGLEIAAAGDSPELYIFNASTGSLTETFYQIGDSATHIQFSYDSSMLLVSSLDKQIHIYGRECHPYYYASEYGLEEKTCPIEHYYNSQTRLCRQCTLDLPGCKLCKNNTHCLTCSGGLQYYFEGNQCKKCSDAVTGCIQCTASNNCLLCDFDYYLTSATQCTLCYQSMDGCLSCNSSTNCLTCSNETHYLNTSTNKCQKCQNIEHCEICISSSSCTSCFPGYYINSNICERCPNYCLNCDNASYCHQCSVGHYGDGNGSCLKCSDECVRCENSTFCNACDVTFYWNTSFCLPCTSNCLACNQTFCFSCHLAYYESSGSCLACQYPCSTCSSATSCLTCRLDHYISGTSCLHCNNLSPFCSSCSNTTCYGCTIGYFFDGSKCQSCNPSLNSCKDCTNSSVCLACLNGYYMNANQCDPCADGCALCDGADCWGCVVGYYLSGSSCVACECPSCNSSSYCFSCYSGYYESSGSCLTCNQSISSCLSCESSSICLSCELGYYLDSSNTTCTLCNSSCMTCNSTSCFSCAVGLFLNGTSQCEPCGGLCERCNSTVCHSCEIGYYLHANGSCIDCDVGCANCLDATVCLQCKTYEGYFLYNNGSCLSCSSSISSCDICTSNLDCQTCLSGFYLSSPTNCSSCSDILLCQNCYNSSYCSNCQIGSYLNSTDGSCLNCGVGCLECLNTTDCSKCGYGYVLSGSSCGVCQSLMRGCQVCNASNVCNNCYEGYYLDGNSCGLCESAIQGCISCSNSSICLLCTSNYYIDSSICLPCVANCLHCNNSTNCINCDEGYYIDPSDSSLCSSCPQNCLLCNSSACFKCLGGYVANGGNCDRCSTIDSSCIFCQSAKCLQCQGGHYLVNNSCQTCQVDGCQICNTSTTCLSCNSQYYLSGSSCLLCETSLPKCIQCSASNICLVCQSSYYLSLTQSCLLCSSLFEGCSLCSNATCLSCLSGYQLSGGACTPCYQLYDGCKVCDNGQCDQCMVNYWYNGSHCVSCLLGDCLTCVSGSQCIKCDFGFMVSSGVCVLCKSLYSNCLACDSTGCLLCEGNVTIAGNTCVQYEVISSSSTFQELSFFTEYVDESSLKHTLVISGQKFIQREAMDLLQQTEIIIVKQGGQVIDLIVTSYEFLQNNIYLCFTTNNPLDFSSSSPFFQQMSTGFRLLDTNMNLNIQFKIKMTQEGTNNIIQSATGKGSLEMSSDTNSPQFLRSISRERHYKYYIFGVVVSIWIVLIYFMKSCCSIPNSFDKGSIIPHILCVKCCGFITYPNYLEYSDYAYGFMVFDLPWLNLRIGELLGNLADEMPEGLKLFYNSINIAGCYGLALLLILGFAFFMVIFYCNFNQSQKQIKILKEYLYFVFIMGLVVASSLSMQGAYYNSIVQLSINSIFYMIGIIVYTIIIFDCLYSFYRKKHNSFTKTRIIVKGTCLTFLHLNPLYFIGAIMIIDFCFIAIEGYLWLDKHKSPCMWIFNQISINLALGILIFLEDYLLAIYLASFLIVVVLIVDAIMHYSEYSALEHMQSLGVNFQSKQILEDNSSENNADLFKFKESTKKVKNTFALNDVVGFEVKKDEHQLYFDNLSEN